LYKKGASVGYRIKGYGDKPQTPALVSRPHPLGMQVESLSKSPIFRPGKHRKSMKISVHKKKKKVKKGNNQAI